MGIWPFSRKRRAPNSGLPRNEAGQFSSPNPAASRSQDVMNAVKSEQTAISGTISVLKDVIGIQTELDKLAQAKAEAMLGAEDEIEGPGNEWIPLVQLGMQMFGPTIQPYIPSILEKMGFQAREQSPVPPTGGGSPSAPEPAAQPSGIQLIKDAAEHSPIAIKLALEAKGYSELEKAGMDKETFKQAITNIYKAIK